MDSIYASHEGEIIQLDSKVALKNLLLTEHEYPIVSQRHAHFAACPYGGPIAFAECRRESSWAVSIYSSSGVSLLEQPFEMGDVFGIAWSQRQLLLVLNRIGRVDKYSALGICDGSFDFSSDINELRDFRTFNYGLSDTGMAVLDDQYRVFVVNSVIEAIPWLMQLPWDTIPTAWTTFNIGGLTTVLCCRNTEFMIGEQGEHMQSLESNWAEKSGEYFRIANNWNCSKFAVLHSAGYIQVLSQNFQSVIHRLTVSGSDPVMQFGWVENEAFYLIRNTSLLQFYSANGEYTDAKLRNHLFVAEECDGIRIFDERSVGFVAPVTESEKKIFGVNSLCDGALLFRAFLGISTTEADKAVYQLYASNCDYEKAIIQCIDAIENCFSVYLQKLLSKIIAFGLASSSNFDKNRLVKFLQYSRLIREANRPSIGFYITYREIEKLSLQSFVNRLCSVNQFALAASISHAINDRVCTETVVRTWLEQLLQKISKTRQNVDFKALDEKIAERINSFPSLSFIDAAKRAHKYGLPQLARLLIKRESDDDKKIEIFLVLKDVHDALLVAAQAKRPHLLQKVIKHLIKMRNRAQFEIEIMKIPEAWSLYAELIEQERSATLLERSKILLSLLEQKSDFDRIILFHIEVASRAESERLQADRISNLAAARAKADEIKDTTISEMLGYISMQEKMNIGARTIREYVIDNITDEQKIDEVKKNFKLSEECLNLWTIEGLVKAHKWEQLFDLTKKKSKFGLLPIIEYCIQYNATEEQISRFVRKANEQGPKMMVHVNILLKRFIEAAKLAYDIRSAELLHIVYCKSAIDPQQHSKVSNLMGALHPQ